MNGYTIYNKNNNNNNPVYIEYTAMTTSEHEGRHIPMAVPIAQTLKVAERQYLSRWKPRMTSVRLLNILATMLHFGNFLGIVILHVMNKKDVVYELNWNQLAFTNFTREEGKNASTYYHMACPATGVPDDSGRETPCGDSFALNFQEFTVFTVVQRTGLWLSVTALVASFFALSFTFEGFWAINGSYYTCVVTTPGAFNYLRYIEYSFSASVMILLLALQCGIW